MFRCGPDIPVTMQPAAKRAKNVCTSTAADDGDNVVEVDAASADVRIEDSQVPESEEVDVDAASASAGEPTVPESTERRGPSGDGRASTVGPSSLGSRGPVTPNEIVHSTPPSSDGSLALCSLEMHQWDPTAISVTPKPNYRPLEVWYAPKEHWRTQVVHVCSDATVDHVKWAISGSAGPCGNFRMLDAATGQHHDRFKKMHEVVSPDRHTVLVACPVLH